MIEEIFIPTEEVLAKAFNVKRPFKETQKLTMKYSILRDFNRGFLNICSSDLFKKYIDSYVPVVVNRNDKYGNKAKIHTKESLDLIHNLIDFLNNNIEDNKIFALFGDSCSGKSFATQKIIDYLWRDFVAINRPVFTDGLGLDKNSWFPFYIDMSMFKEEITNSFIEVALNKQYTLSYPQIDYLKKHCSCLIILDHFELTKNMLQASSDYVSIFQEWRKSKFFITCSSNIVGIEHFNQCFYGFQSKGECIVHYYLNKFSSYLLHKTSISNWVNQNFNYIKESLSSFNSFFSVNLQFTTAELMLKSLTNYMMQVAFYMYIDDELIINLNKVNFYQNALITDGSLFWRLCLINWGFNVVEIFPVVNSHNSAGAQCFFSIKHENKDYFIKMQKSFRNYFVAMCLWRDLINNSLEEFFNRLRFRNLTEESGVVDCLVEFFDKLQDSEKNNLQTLIRTTLIGVDKTDVNVFSGLNAILKEFDLVNDYPLAAKSDPTKSDDFQEKPVLFSYSSTSLTSIDPELKQQNKVNLICNGHGFSLLCFELYSPTKKTMRTYYVKLAEEEANVVLEKNSPNVKDFKRTDIVDLFAGTSQDVPEARKENIKKLFLNKSSLLFV